MALAVGKLKKTAIIYIVSLTFSIPWMQLDLSASFFFLHKFLCTTTQRKNKKQMSFVLGKACSLIVKNNSSDRLKRLFSSRIGKYKFFSLHSTVNWFCPLLIMSGYSTFQTAVSLIQLLNGAQLWPLRVLGHTGPLLFILSRISFMFFHL